MGPRIEGEAPPRPLGGVVSAAEVPLMAHPPLSLYERLRGKRLHDIELPNLTGERDRRLPSRETGSNIKKGWQAVRPLLTRSARKK